MIFFCVLDTGLFRESYVLTMTQTLDSNDTTTDSDNFTQMTFDSFAEVIFRIFIVENRRTQELYLTSHTNSWKTWI